MEVYIRLFFPEKRAGSGDHTLFRASGEYDGHIVNEIKVMVPCQEVIQAEDILRDLEKNHELYVVPKK